MYTHICTYACIYTYIYIYVCMYMYDVEMFLERVPQRTRRKLVSAVVWFYRLGRPQAKRFPSVRRLKSWKTTTSDPKPREKGTPA